MVAFACNNCGNRMQGFATSCSRCGRTDLTLASESSAAANEFGASGSKSLSEQLTENSSSFESQSKRNAQKQSQYPQSGSYSQSKPSQPGSNSLSSKPAEPRWDDQSSVSSEPSWKAQSSKGTEPRWDSQSSRDGSSAQSNWTSQSPESKSWKSPESAWSKNADRSTTTNSREKTPERPAGLGTLLFGVLVPTAAIIFETQTHFCALSFFDPLPSMTHVMFFSLIPLTSLMAWLAGRRKFNPDTDMTTHAGVLSLFSGMAMGIAILYSLMFLPMAPISILAIALLGMGLLGLSPMLSIPCILKSGKVASSLAERENSYADPHQLKHIGHLIILVMVIALELPSTLTRIHLAQAADSNPQTQLNGLKWLRSFGNEEVLLRACYERSGRATDILGSLWEFSHPTGVQAARDVFYKVTGKPFNTVPIPAAARATMQNAGIMSDPADLNAGVEDEFDYDADIAGEIVSGVARGLSISGSKISGTIDPDATLANLQWAFTLSNTSKYDREARAKILLPPNAVVSKATLTVNGEERDAVIMGRSEARAIYRRAVVEKKDPLLVSMCGPDNLLVQCFPVRPNDKMLIKLYMAAPMQMTSTDHAMLMLPAFDERNFQIDVHHDVDLASNGKSVDLSCKGLKTTAKGDKVLITGAVDTAELARGDTTLSASRNQQVTTVFADASTESRGQDLVDVVRSVQSAQFSPAVEHHAAPASLTVLIDGSVGMSPFLPAVLNGLQALPTNVSTSIEFVKDGEAVLNSADELTNVRCEGGQENAAPLLKALSKHSSTNGSVLWIHAAQPICNNATKSHIQRVFDYSTSPVLLYDMQVVAGANEILDGCRTMNSIVRVHRSGSIETDLKNLFQSWKQPVQSVVDAGTGLRVPTSQSLCDLDAYRQVRELLAQQNQREAARIAVGQHIITPVSSAVVTMNLPATNPAPTPKAPDSRAQSYRSGLRSMLADNFGAIGDREALSANKKRMYSAATVCEEAKCKEAPASAPARALGTIGPQGDSAVDIVRIREDGSDKKGEFNTLASADIDQFSAQGGQGLDESGGTAGSDAGTAASVPESDTWLLLAVGVLLLGSAVYLKKRGVAVRV